MTNHPNRSRLRMGRIVREAERWTGILGPLSVYEAAERICGDLVHYRTYYRGAELSSNYSGDMEKLAGALLAIAALSQGEEPKPFAGESELPDVVNLLRRQPAG